MPTPGICSSHSRRLSPVRRPRAFVASALVAAGLIALVGSGEARADRAVARALVEEGQRLSRAGRAAVALERLERAIDEDPDYLLAYEIAVGLWLRANDFEPIIRHLARVTLRHPRYGFGWYTLAFAYRRTGRHDLAVLCYREYLELRPDEPDPYFGMGMSLVALDRRDEARASFGRYLEMERRPEQREFVSRARSELARLGGDSSAIGTVTAAEWNVLRRALVRFDALARELGRRLAAR